MYDINALLARFDEWEKERTANYEREEDSPVSSSTWQNSDDDGVNLAQEFAAALREETLCLICTEPIRLSWIHPRSNGNHGSLECGAGDGSIATQSTTPAPPAPREVWTCTVKTPDSPGIFTWVCATEEDCWESLREHYDPEGVVDTVSPVAIVNQLMDEGYVIDVDVHTI